VRNVKIVLLTVVMVMACIVPNSFAEVETSGSASVDVMSSYVWRGIQIHEDVAIQPSVGITYGGFGANFWADYDTDSDVEEMIETDLTLNYSFSVGKLGLDVGYIYYALDYDFDEGEGGFVVTSIGHSFAFLDDKLSLDLGASASYNIENLIMGVDEDGDEFSDFYNGELTASLGYSINDAFSAGASIAYSVPLSDDAENSIEAMSEDGDSDQLYGGVSLALNF
jgi:outer membrane scaffolding protein for murein synthesis (MipA/OmpV family)